MLEHAKIVQCYKVLGNEPRLAAVQDIQRTVDRKFLDGRRIIVGQDPAAVQAAVLLRAVPKPAGECFFIVFDGRESHKGGDPAYFLITAQKVDLRPLRTGEGKKIPETDAKIVFDQVGKIAGAEMLHGSQIRQGDPGVVMFINIVYDMADPLFYHWVAAVEVDDDVVPEGEEIKILIQLVDYRKTDADAAVLVVYVLLKVAGQQLQQRKPQLRQVPVGLPGRIGPVAAQRKVRVELGEEQVADMDQGRNVVP